MHGFAITNATSRELKDCSEVINDLLGHGKLRARIARVMPLAETAAAHRSLEDSERGAVKLGGKLWLLLG